MLGGINFYNIGKRKILVVDDNKMNQEILKAILGNEYSVITASNGLEGIDQLTTNINEISLVLLDLNMPICNGYQFLQRRRASSILSAVPVVVITAEGRDDDEVKCLQLGAIDFIIKPFNADSVKSRIQNIIKLRESEVALSKVEYDDTTGLLSMAAFYHHTEEILKTNQGKSFDLVLLDLVSLKTFGHVFGEKRGDDLLQKIGNYLNEYGNIALFSRKGECFFAFIDSDNFEEIDEITDHIKDKLKEMSAISLKMNTVIYRSIDKSKDMQYHCNNMMVAAENLKNDYKNDTYIYNDGARQQIEEGQRIGAFFESALRTKQIKLFFQPKVDAKTGNIVSAEALARWLKDDGTYIMPGKFIPILEKNGKIKQLDEYMFRNVCEYQSERIAAGKKVIPISVNLSRHSVYSLDTVATYAEIIKEEGIDFSLVPLELTESATGESSSIMEIAKKFSDYGFTLHMDDFGAGYSSLTDLSSLPFSVVKLDKSMVDSLQYAKGRTITESMIKIAHDIDLSVVAEGVETQSQLDFLKSAGVDTIQGFFYYPPQDMANFNALLDKSAKPAE